MNMDSHANEPARSKESNRRRNYLIDPSFQWRYAVMVTVAVFVLTALMSSVLYSVLHQQARERLMNPEGATAAVSGAVLVAALAFAAVTSGALGLWCIMFTHRICGPLHVLGGYLRQMSEGKLPEPRALRKKDEFKELYASFTKVVERLRRDRTHELEAMNAALQAVGDADGQDLDACQQALRDVTLQLEPLCHELAAALGTEVPTASEKRVPEFEPFEPVSVG